MKLKDIFEMAEAGVTSVGFGALAQFEKRITPMRKRDYINIFLNKRKLARASGKNDWISLDS